MKTIKILKLILLSLFLQLQLQADKGDFEKVSLSASMETPIPVCWI